METTPLSARFWFQKRDYVFIPLCFIGFAILFLLSEQVLGAWLGLLFSMIVVLFVYFMFINNLVVGFDCPHCHQYIATNTPWICGGDDQCKNKNTEDFPFIHRCQHCQVEPKSYECHHCGGIIFLTRDHQKRGAARCLTAPIEKEEDPLVSGFEKEKQKRELELVLIRLDGELDAAKQMRERSRKKTHLEKAEENLAEFKGGGMAVEEIAEREKAANAEQFKDNPAKRKRADKWVDDWVKKNIV